MIRILEAFDAHGMKVADASRSSRKPDANAARRYVQWHDAAHRVDVTTPYNMARYVQTQQDAIDCIIRECSLAVVIRAYKHAGSWLPGSTPVRTITTKPQPAGRPRKDSAL